MISSKAFVLLFSCFILNLAIAQAKSVIVKQNIEGWTVLIDASLIDGKHKELGKKVLKSLKHRLYQITTLVPKKRLEELKTIQIRLEYQNPRLGGMQYHPSLEWLKENGHDPLLEKKVHIPVAKNLISKEQIFKHPFVVLHELAHGYHDQFLSFDNERIIQVYKNAMKKKTYHKTMDHHGRVVKHYATSNHKEFFAEFTETYFGLNDFYPFIHAELKKTDPEVFKLMEDIWGKRTDK